MRKRAPVAGELAKLVRRNLKLARCWTAAPLRAGAIDRLRDLTLRFEFSVALGDLVYLDGNWYITHAGLVRLASRRRCAGIEVQHMPESCEPLNARWVFKATVYRCRGSRGFVGHGDADPSNVSSLMHGAEMRIAETRAVNRALRKAYGIGLCSVEELGSFSSNSGRTRNHQESNQQESAKESKNGSNNGQPRLRDQLCLLIRQHNLDPTLVKAYAADFCGTPSLKEANRDLVQSFVSHLAACAKENRDMLICRLNSYAQPVEVKA
jgi:hypothetical protein